MGKPQYRLGLDLGVNSLGWAAIRVEDGTASGILAAGVRIFEAGVDGMEKDGKGVSRNQDRRQARQIRRQLERRSRRRVKLFRLLQAQGLLPRGECGSGDLRNRLLNRLDEKIKKSRFGGTPSQDVQIPYALRTLALDEKLGPFELGRALYHLAQRRGFLSNRKSGKKENDEGPVKEGISFLAGKISDSGARTLGEYFNGLDPAESPIRSRWTAREMYRSEFELIWEGQVRHHPELLTPALKEQVFSTIFKQRPLKSAKHLIGRCELEPGKHRAPLACVDFQRFRYLQRLNDLEVLEATGELRPLRVEERDLLTTAFEEKGDRTFKQIRTLLGLKGTHFNLEDGGEKRLTGNRSYTKVAAAFGEGWASLPEIERRELIEEMLSVGKEAVLARRITKLWGLDAESARDVAAVQLEDGHARFSRKALRRLLPALESGIRLNSAIKAEYGDQDKESQALDQMPPVLTAIPELRNPVVNRSLTELRKVVNAIVREYGKPEFIRVELVRDLKKSPKHRESAWKRNRAREKERKAAAAEIVNEAGIQEPSRADIEKVLLADECDWTCPYTGKAISMASLIEGNFDVEHIIPFRRSLDNTFLNKTLCEANENRRLKGDRTPEEAYGGDADRWEEIQERVSRFKGGLAREKLRRFRMTDDEVQDLLDDFTDRQLADTAYAARLAVNYLGSLYGGPIDADGKRRVRVVGGQAAAFFRSEWGLNPILGDGPRKSRDDHRHHAVDSIVIALSDDAQIRNLSTAAGRAQMEGRRRFGKVDPPWPGFREEAAAVIDEIVASHRRSRVLRGKLHEETIYSPPRDETGRPNASGGYVHIRKPIDKLSKSDLENIVDDSVRDAVDGKLQELVLPPDRAFADPRNLPLHPSGDRIKKVRVRRKQHITPLGKGFRERHVMTGANHHLEVLLTKGKNRQEKWTGEVVSLLEAVQRRKRGEPVVRRDHGPEKEFLFSLAGGDCIELVDGDGVVELFVVRVISSVTTNGIEYPRVSFVSIFDARKKADILSAKDWQSMLLDPLRRRECRKVMIDPIGSCMPCHD